MCNARQFVVWLVLMGSALTSDPSFAQQGSGSGARGHVESDTQLAAASEVWHRAWRANIETRLRKVAARGTPRDLLVAGWLWPQDSEGRDPQARAWLESAYARSTGADPLVDWALLDACKTPNMTCDRGLLLRRLMAADPDNAEPLLAAYHDAIQQRNSAAAERYWQAAAGATHYRSHFNDLGLLMATTLREIPAPPLDPVLAAGIGDDLMLGRSATTRDMADIAVIATHAAIAIPTLQPITQRCRVQVGRLPPDARSACKRIYLLLASDASILIGPAIALPQLVQWADDDAERDAARERLRRFAWVRESSMQIHLRPGGERRTPPDYGDVLLRSGEFAAMRYLMRSNGVASEPAADWLPDNPDYRALITGKPETLR